MKSVSLTRAVPTALTFLLLPMAAFAQEPEPVVETVVPGVKLISSSDSARTTDPLYAATMVLEGEVGVYNAPIAPTVAQSIQNDWEATGRDPEALYFVNPDAAEAIERSLSTGIMDPSLEPYLEPLDTTLEPTDDGPTDDGPFLAKGKSCSDKIKTKDKAVSLNFNGYNGSTNIGPFTGTLGIDADISGSATVVLTYRVKRKKVIFACVPTAVKFENVRTYGSGNVGGDISLEGELSNMSNPWSWQKQIAKPRIGSLNFLVGPVPVRIGFKLPIDVGLEVGVSASAGLKYSLDGNAAGSFDYTCTMGSCSGSSSFSSTFTTGSGRLLYNLSGRADIKAWLQVGVRAHLYAENVAYAQVGVRPKLYGDLWGYYGNGCGDRDHDGTHETVDALTMDLDWQVFITAQASALGGKPKKWNDLWHSERKHIRFWDLIGSDAIAPLLHGPASTPVSTSTQYKAQMGSCWPYSDMINYSMDWDGSTQTFTNTPTAWKNIYRSWSTGGDKNIALKAVSDSHGRSLNKTTYRTVNVTSTGSGGGGGDGGGGDGGGTVDPPLVNLRCMANDDVLGCFARVAGGVTPYSFYWSVNDGSWSVGPQSRSFSCSLQGDSDPASLRVKVKGGDGQWSNISTYSCIGG